jgi:glycosyltransferase involved in cell wall biosynthesis
VVAIHDVSFAARPDWFTTREGLRRRWLSRQSAMQARAIITISQFSRREIVDRFGVGESQVQVIPPGIDRLAPQPRAAQERTAFNVLFVGSIFNRRHLPELIRAFGPLARKYPAAMLDLVGENRSHPHQNLTSVIENEGLAGRAQWRPRVTEEELGALYGGARAFAFLSEYEGLGLTPLEAIAMGVPAVLLDTAVARESCGDAALYVPLEDHGQATRALEALLFDDAVRRRLLAAAPDVLSRYSWPRAARDTLAVLERAAGGT